jgi:hypothetical protein
MNVRWWSHPEVKQHGLRSGTLVKDWFFDALGARFCLTAPFSFDGASVPVPFWWVALPFSPWVVVAALVHDWLYRHHAYAFAFVCVGGVCRQITRREADRIFLQVMVQEIYRLCPGQGRLARCARARLIWRAHAMYLAVRKFAGFWWNEAENNCKTVGGGIV